MTIIDKRRGLGAGSDAAQQAVQRAIDTNVPDHVKTGLRLTSIVFDASQAPTPGAGVSVSIPHKLNRNLSGWHTLRVVSPKINDPNIVETASDANTLSLKMMTAATTGTVTVDLWVF